MNIQNIISLTEMLAATGFDGSIGQRLLQHICFKPSDFYLTEKLVKGKDVLTCSIHFERKDDFYTCHYYDAAFLKAIELPELTIQGINIRELDKRMNEIDWSMKEVTATSFNLQDASGWQREKQIEQIVTDLSRLSAFEDGRYYADSLKVKHWLDVPVIYANLTATRSKFEVSQRFYFFDGQGIAVDEAYRFLLNRWLEKKLHGKKKQAADPDAAATDETANGGTDKSLLQKKRKRRTNKIAR
ncbi:MAG: hypothetical protein J0I32_11065 [Sphingobacteriales bacterium]|nr:hypothetical protein [Sphingobacteriales bacterium]OJW01180.1 MAG: hypothetical protein BGO52_07035 [Sphingobacteriales bacterium 44-61]